MGNHNNIPQGAIHNLSHHMHVWVEASINAQRWYTVLILGLSTIDPALILDPLHTPFTSIQQYYLYCSSCKLKHILGVAISFSISVYEYTFYLSIIILLLVLYCLYYSYSLQSLSPLKTTSLYFIWLILYNVSNINLALMLVYTRHYLLL